jgi:hypothetical protein
LNLHILAQIADVTIEIRLTTVENNVDDLVDRSNTTDNLVRRLLDYPERMDSYRDRNND